MNTLNIRNAARYPDTASHDAWASWIVLRGRQRKAFSDRWVWRVGGHKTDGAV
jgi:hypothetical protein